MTDTTVNNAYGHFLWAATNFPSNNANRSAYLYSEILLAYHYQRGGCLTFSYFLTGLSSLSVYFRERPAGQDPKLLWSMKNDQGNKWLQKNIDIPITAADCEVKKTSDEQKIFYKLKKKK